MAAAHHRIQRVFLGWERPCLELGIDQLVARYGSADPIFERVVDLEGVITVLPGKRAARRLLELLVSRSEREGFCLVPPRIITIGELPELLVPPPERRVTPHAPPLAQRLAWARALEKSPEDELKKFTASLPEKEKRASADTLLHWLRLGEQCVSVWRELSSSMLTFRDARSRAESLTTFCDEERWEFLCELFDRYVEELSTEGFVDPALEYMRVAQSTAAECGKEIVLIATSDLSPLFKELLRSPGLTVSAYIYAPDDESSSFDDCGALVKEQWLTRNLKIGDDQIFFGEDSDGEGECIFSGFGSLSNTLSPHEVTIGYTDANLLPSIEYACVARGVPVQRAATRPLSQSAPHLFLRALLRILTNDRFDAFAALVRHPAVAQYVTTSYVREFGEAPPDLAALLDGYHYRHLPHLLEPHSLVIDPRQETLRRVLSLVDSIVGPFKDSSIEWSVFFDRLISTIQKLFPDTGDEESLCVKEQVVRLFEQGAEIDGDLLPPMSGAAFISLLLSQTGREESPGLGGLDGVEVLGWLELQLDDAPMLAIVGMNEGAVPEAITSDAFLPESLRHHLGLKDNDSRLARDLYVLASIHASRRVVLIAGRRGATGEPLLLSRLLLSDTPEVVAARVARFYSERTTKGKRKDAPSELSASPFPIPVKPDAAPPVNTLSVTAFGDYLKCPYRFYLKHIRRLRRIDDENREMDGALYGELTHGVLNQFGQSQVAGSTDERAIREFLVDALSKAAYDRFGKFPIPAVIVQLRQLEERLGHFAAWQAEWAAEGWNIVRTEFPLVPPVSQIEVDGVPFTIRGRIDRIDRHLDGRFILFDYKTGDRGESAEKAHRRRGEWIDLQLPLYAHLSKRSDELKISVTPQLGYILLPKEGSDTKASLVEWTSDDLQSAWHVVEEVIRKVRKQEFWPPAEVAGAFDEFAALCGVGQLGEGVREEGEVNA